MKRIAFSRKYLAIPYALFMALFIVIPLFLIIFYAFTDSNFHFSIHNITRFFVTSEAITALIKSLMVALFSTVVCLLIGYPVSYILSKMNMKKSGIIVTLFLLPMWMNFLLRTLATLGIFTMLGVKPGMIPTMLGMVYNFLPFMILPVFTALCKIDKSLIEASEDLGATPSQVFFKTIIPLSLPGVISGVTMVFMPCISTFVISDMLSRNTIMLFGNIINLNFQAGGDWNYGSALSLLMLIFILISTLLTNKFQNNEETNGLW